MSKFYITTPIYYVNDKPHLGHAYTTLCADVLARWHRQKGDNVFFLTGTDEHGAKVEQSAKAAGLDPLAFATQNADRFKLAWEYLNIKYDYFIRTSQPEHEKVASELLQRIYDKGYVYAGEYEGLYCVGCERFLKEDELTNGRCPLHPNQEPVKQNEKNYFFKLKEFTKPLLEAIEKGDYQIVPEARRNEIVGKIKQGLEDISISRQSVEWGVRVPWDDNQTIYVWIEALINYYSATQFVPGKKEFWPADVHLLAKDIVWFHAVIWEALLMAAGLPLPKVVATHGFFTIDGQKMSKSLGNVIDPNDLVKEFGVEAARYLIMSQLPFVTDGDVSLARFRERYESDLANGLGNTFSRVTNMAEKFCNGVVEKGELKQSILEGSSKEQDLGVVVNLESFQFDQSLQAIFSVVRFINQNIEQTKPWENSANRANEINGLLYYWVNALLQVGKYLQPFMPETSKKITETLSAERITKAEPLFPRLAK